MHNKFVSAVTNNHTTAGELLEAVFCMWSVLRLCKENQHEFLGVENVSELPP
jgi:hypothetical protein